jgi:hypothetical protein
LVEKSRHGLGARVMTLIVLTFLICAADGTACEPGLPWLWGRRRIC